MSRLKDSNIKEKIELFSRLVANALAVSGGKMGRDELSVLRDLVREHRIPPEVVHQVWKERKLPGMEIGVWKRWGLRLMGVIVISILALGLWVDLNKGKLKVNIPAGSALHIQRNGKDVYALSGPKADFLVPLTPGEYRLRFDANESPYFKAAEETVQVKSKKIIPFSPGRGEGTVQVQAFFGKANKEIKGAGISLKSSFSPEQEKLIYSGEKGQLEAGKYEIGGRIRSKDTKKQYRLKGPKKVDISQGKTTLLNIRLEETLKDRTIRQINEGQVALAKIRESEKELSGSTEAELSKAKRAIGELSKFQEQEPLPSGVIKRAQDADTLIEGTAKTVAGSGQKMGDGIASIKDKVGKITDFIQGVEESGPDEWQPVKKMRDGWSAGVTQAQKSLKEELALLQKELESTRANLKGILKQLAEKASSEAEGVVPSQMGKWINAQYPLLSEPLKKAQAFLEEGKKAYYEGRYVEAITLDIKARTDLETWLEETKKSLNDKIVRQISAGQVALAKIRESEKELAGTGEDGLARAKGAIGELSKFQEQEPLPSGVIKRAQDADTLIEGVAKTVAGSGQNIGDSIASIKDKVGKVTDLIQRIEGFIPGEWQPVKKMRDGWSAGVAQAQKSLNEELAFFGKGLESTRNNFQAILKDLAKKASKETEKVISQVEKWINAQYPALSKSLKKARELLQGSGKAYNEGRYVEAVTLAIKARELVKSPTVWIEEMLAEGKKIHEQGDNGKAIKIFKMIIKVARHPTNNKIYIYLQESNYNIGLLHLSESTGISGEKEVTLFLEALNSFARVEDPDHGEIIFPSFKYRISFLSMKRWKIAKEKEFLIRKTVVVQKELQGSPNLTDENKRVLRDALGRLDEMYLVLKAREKFAAELKITSWGNVTKLLLPLDRTVKTPAVK